jgi:hypothetical protein
LRLRLAVFLVLAAVAPARAQQTVTPVAPHPGLPSTFPQFQTYSGCLMNCDTRSVTCQSTCSVTNAPTSTFATTTTGTRPDAGTLAQCYIGCNTQALSCKQTCAPPH